MQGKAIRGAGSLQSTVLQYTNNVPVFQFSSPDTHNIYLHDLGIEYKQQQPATNTNAYGIGFNSAMGSANGFYHFIFERLSFRDAAVGIGINQKSGMQTVWNFSLSDTSFYSISKHIVNFNPPTPIGMPMHLYSNIRVFNTGDGVVPDGEAFVFSAVEAEIEHLDIEGWHNTIFHGVGGPNFVIRHVHIEHHVFDNLNNQDLFYFANGSLAVENLTFTGVSNNTAEITLFHPDDSVAKLYLRQISVDLLEKGGKAVVIAANESPAYIQDVDANIAITFPDGNYPKNVFDLDASSTVK
jgi:hypothetical protein